eukprot:m.254978 g.254978  ORF g.254978 m.254978 type:complete len:242 (+) comp11009_c1_seq19:3031-3756(+)
MSVAPLLVKIRAWRERKERHSQQQKEEQLRDAARDGRDDEAKQLLKDGTSVNCTDDEFGWTPLHFAAFNGRQSVVAVLVAHGADIHCRNSLGWTPLHHTAAYGQRDIAELLIAHGADIHCKNNDGWTPLHCAATDGRQNAAELLIAYGADIHCRNNNGDTPLDLSKIPGQRVAMEQQYAVRQQQYWNRRTPLAFGVGAERILITTLLCAKRRGLHLPVELWQHVFSHLQRRDFAIAAASAL